MKSDTRDAKRYLKQIGVFEIRIKTLETEIALIKYRMGDVAAVSYETKEGMSGSHNTKSPQEIVIERLCRYEQDLQKVKNDYIIVRKEIVENILKLSDRKMIEVLYRRYVQMHDWDDIAKNLSFSRMHVNRIHGDALEEISKIIKDVTKCYI